MISKSRIKRQSRSLRSRWLHATMLSVLALPIEAACIQVDAFSKLSDYKNKVDQWKEYSHQWQGYIDNHRSSLDSVEAMQNKIDPVISKVSYLKAADLETIPFQLPDSPDDGWRNYDWSKLPEKVYQYNFTEPTAEEEAFKSLGWMPKPITIHLTDMSDKSSFSRHSEIQTERNKLNRLRQSYNKLRYEYGANIGFFAGRTPDEIWSILDADREQAAYEYGDLAQLENRLQYHAYITHNLDLIDPDEINELESHFNAMEKVVKAVHYDEVRDKLEQHSVKDALGSSRIVYEDRESAQAIIENQTEEVVDRLVMRGQIRIVDYYWGLLRWVREHPELAKGDQFLRNELSPEEALQLSRIFLGAPDFVDQQQMPETAVTETQLNEFELAAQSHLMRRSLIRESLVNRVIQKPQLDQWRSALSDYLSVEQINSESLGNLQSLQAAMAQMEARIRIEQLKVASRLERLEGILMQDEGFTFGDGLGNPN